MKNRVVATPNPYLEVMHYVDSSKKGGGPRGRQGRTHGNPRMSVDILDVHGPCPATSEHRRKAVDTILSQIEALNIHLIHQPISIPTSVPVDDAGSRRGTSRKVTLGVEAGPPGKSRSSGLAGRE